METITAEDCGCQECLKTATDKKPCGYFVLVDGNITSHFYCEGSMYLNQVCKKQSKQR